MGKYGRGLALALFFILSLSRPVQVSAQSPGGGFPVIAQMNRRDDGFRQFIADVEANRRLVFLRNRRQGITGETIAEALTIFSYTVRDGDDLFSLAARGNIPFSTLASLNRLTNRSSVRADMTLLLPSVPGIFVPASPDSELERLMASGRLHLEDEGRSTIAIPVSSGGQVEFYFFPGDEFSSVERAFFLNPGLFRFPLLSYRLTSGYGMRENPLGNNMHFHPGLDLAAPHGTEIFAAADGIVTETGFDRILGNFVKVSHAGGWTSVYGHMRNIGTTVGARVGAGALIGWVGSTGYSTGPHLHFELWQGERSRDPGDVLRR